MTAKQERLKMLKMLNEAKEILISDYPHTQRASVNAKGKLFIILENLIVRAYADEIASDEHQALHDEIMSEMTWEDFR